MRDLHEIEVEIENQERLLDEAQNNIDSFDPSEFYEESEHIDHLNECYGTVEVCGMTMDSGTVLYDQDYPAFREDLNNYLDGIDLCIFNEYNELVEEHNVIEEKLDELQEELEEKLDEEENE